MKAYILIILFLLPIVYGVDVISGDDTIITTVGQCTGQITVKTQMKNNTYKGQYGIKDCQNNNDVWLCPCNNPFDVVFQSQNNIKGIVDIIISYDVDTPILNTNNTNLKLIINESAERTETFEGVQVRQNKPPQSSFSLVSVFSSFIFIFIFGGILVIIFLVLGLVFRYIIKGEKIQNSDIEVKDNKTKESEPTDEEIDEFLRNNI